MDFLNEAHRKKYEECCSRAEVHPEDRERKSLFYILAGCPAWLIKKDRPEIEEKQKEIGRFD